MQKVIVRAPTRVDLAGGTLDLWPLYLFFPESCTVNVAVSLYATCEITRLDDASIEVSLPDDDYEQRYESLSEVSRDPRVRIVAGAADHFKLNGIRIEMRSDAPRGSGLGGSSALAICLVRGLSEIAEQPQEGEELIALVRDLETRLLGVPAGIQDYYPAVFGGLGTIRLDPGRVHRQPLKVSLTELADHLVLHDSGIEHFSGSNNWEIYKKVIDGDSAVRTSLAGIAAASIAMESALNSFDLLAAGGAIAEEWRHRKALAVGVSTPAIDQLIHVASRAGAWGGKVCGAGGGGVIALLVDPTRRQEVIEALGELPGTTLEASPVGPGMTVEFFGAAGFAVPGKRVSRLDLAGEELEQYFLAASESDLLRPYLMVEFSITWDDGRSGFRHVEERCWVAPVNLETERIEWNERTWVDLSGVDLYPNPPDQESPDSRRVDSVFAAARNGLETLPDLVVENEKLELWSNPSLGLSSRPGESRESFEARCRESAESKRAAANEALEGTFRRRVDQVRERFEKDLKALADSSEDGSERPELSDSGIQWGQFLHDIMSGKPLRRSSGPATEVETDYLRKLEGLRKAWEREQSALDDEVAASVRNIEETVISPSRNLLDVQRTRVIWAPSIGAFGA